MGGKLSIIDMAGFGDNRDEVGVVAVSYFLINYFEKVKKVKFIIAISESSLYL
jgi:hypothetical protein